MIRIRYADLPEGWHVQAVAEGRRTVIYLRPGLTPQQRSESLRRVRQSARMGYGPRLPAAEVAIAVAADSLRSTLRNLGGAVRWHLLGSLLLVAGMALAAVCYVLLVTVSIRFLGPASPGLALPHGGRMPAQAAQGRGAPPVSPRGIAAGSSGGSGAQGARSRAGGSSPRTSGSPGARPPRSPRPTPSPGGHSPAPSPSPSPTTASPPPTRSPSPRPTHSPQPSPSPSSTCILIICL